MKKWMAVIAACLLLSALFTVGFAAEQELLTTDTQWVYLDDGTDPAAGLADRTAWAAEDFAVTSAWKTAAGPFGSKRGAAALESGYTANTILAGCTGSANHPAYFFRAEFTVDALPQGGYLSGLLQHDDGAIVYINGVRVAAFEDLATDAAGNSLDKPFDANLQYGGATLATPRTGTFVLEDLSMLHTGVNTIAVEIHQRSAGSSDVWFDMPQLILSDEPVFYPQNNIILNPGADESAMNFTWYMPDDTPGELQLCPADALVEGKLPPDARCIPSATELTNDGQYANKVCADGLAPDTQYAYRLVNGEHETNMAFFRTPSAGAFSFVFSGDPQVGGTTAQNDALLWGNSLSIVGSADVFEGVRFLLSAGDQVNLGDNESYYDAFLQSDVLRSLPVAVTVGNHDNTTFGRGDETKVNAFRQHYNTPNASEAYGVTTAGSNYWFAYNDVLFMVLNVNDQSAAEHRAFMQEAIAAEPDAVWRVVVFHHSLYSLASHAFDSDILSRRETLVPIFNELDVDVVLMGHDHVYCRTYLMDGLTPVTDPAAYDDASLTSATDPDGILFVTANSGSGNKTYTIRNASFPYAAVQNQEHIGNLSRVDVTDRSFTITTYRLTDLSVVDTFTIYRTSPGADLADRIAALEAPTPQQLIQLRQDYEALSRQEKLLVRNYDTLVAAEKAMQVQLAQAALDHAADAAAFADAAAASAQTAAEAVQQAKHLTPGDAVAKELADRAAEAAHAAEAAAQTAARSAEETAAAATVAEAHRAEQAAAAAAAEAAAHADAAAQAAGTLLERCACPSEGMKDVPAEVWYHEAVDYVLAKGIMRGSGSATFAPDKPLTRAMLVQMLYNMEGRPDCAAESSFTDVAKDAWYCSAVTWAAENGIVSGYAGGGFGPNDPVTRQQMVTILWRYCGSPKLKVYKLPFTDAAQVSQYAKRAVIWATETGVVSGMGDGRFVPNGNTTRAQAAQVLRNYLEKVAP